MEKIKYKIIKTSNNICRIEACDIRKTFRNIADGGCICSIDVMLSEIEHITRETKKYGKEACFVMS